jgi:hypothetical protein
MQVEPKADLNKLGAGLLTDEHKFSLHSLWTRVSGRVSNGRPFTRTQTIAVEKHTEMLVSNRRKSRWTLDVEFIAGGENDGKYLPPGNAIENTA